MKRKILDRKLVLNKETISDFEGKELSKIKGGTFLSIIYNSCDPKITCVFTNEWERCVC